MASNRQTASHGEPKSLASKDVDAEDAGPERQRFSPEYRRKQILAAARRVFLANPDASIRDVADEAGVTRQLVGLYFPGGGTGPIFAALFDEFMRALPTFLEGASRLLEDRAPGSSVAVDDETMRDLITGMVESFFEWVEAEFEIPWLFGSGRDRPGSGIGARWDASASAFVDTLITLRPDFANSIEVRSALVAEGEATAKLIHMFLSGVIGLEAAKRTVIERQFALYTVAIPELLKQGEAQDFRTRGSGSRGDRI